MSNKIVIAGTTVFAWLTLVSPAGAQAAQFDLNGLYTAVPGSQGNTSYATGAGPGAIPATQVPNPTSNQSTGTLPTTALAGLAPVFGLTMAGLSAGWGGSGGFAGPGGYTATGGAGGPGWAGPGSNLAALQSTLPGSTFAQNHPRRAEVLEGDSALYNQINSDYGYLGGNYPQLINQSLAIQNQEQNDSVQNGGFITQAQQAQLNQEEAALQQQVSYDNSLGPPVGNTGF